MAQSSDEFVNSDVSLKSSNNNLCDTSVKSDNLSNDTSSQNNEPEQSEDKSQKNQEEEMHNPNPDLSQAEKREVEEHLLDDMSGKENSSLLDSIKDSPEEKDNDVDDDGWLDILGSGSLKKRVITPGEPKNRPQRNDVVSLVFTTKLETGKVIRQDENVTFTVGDGEVIQGLDLGVAMMEVGEVAEFFVASKFGWDKEGFEEIPPNSNLTLIVTLKSFHIEPDMDKMSVADRLSTGEIKKERGNFWYGRQKYSQAVQCYRRALEYLDDTTDATQETSDEVMELLDHRLKVFNNMAAAQMKMNAFAAALRSVDNVLLCQPNNIKALFRKGKILAELGKPTEAMMVLRKAEQLSPSDKSINAEINRLSGIIRKANLKERSMYQKMFGITQTNPKATRSSYNNWVVWASVAGGLTAAALGVMAYRFKLF